jgi:adenylate cyclase class 2
MPKKTLELAMNPSLPVETEVKLRIPSTHGWAARLEALGFRQEIPPQQEESVLWDRAAELLGQGCALRLRRHAGRATLTWKGPKREDPVLKVRPELETAVEDPGALEGILRALGYAPVMEMRKNRGVWRRADLLACLDEAPFGCYLELEGDRDAIARGMAELDLGPGDAEPRSYPTLFRELA